MNTPAPHLTKSFRQKAVALLTWIGWAILTQFIFINIMAAFYAWKMTHYYPHLSDHYSNGGGNIFQRTWHLFTGPKYPRPANGAPPVFPLKEVALRTKTGLPVAAWHASSDSASKGTVILFHGITQTRSELVNQANEFHYLGYNVFLVDFRGHGDSGGNTTTAGVRESEEVRLAYDYIISTGEKRIILYGVSMGAVAIARSVAVYNLQPAGVILDMPFRTLQTYLKGRARMLGFPTQPFAFFTTFWIGVEQGFNGYSHNTEKYMTRIRVPLLLQWGARDRFVPEQDTRRLYEACASDRKKWVVYDDCAHESLLWREPERWRSEVSAFLQTRLN
jgi:alpha-beta hydrolase superfamily lysophospholipase